MAGMVRRFAISFFFVFVTGNLYAQDHGRPNFSFGLNVGFTQSFLPDHVGEITHIPSSLRQVPSHENDTWIYGNRTVTRTIPFDSYDVGGLAVLSPSISPEITIQRFRVRAGISFSLVADQSFDPHKPESIREINQYGKSVRGSGTSLVYYGMSPRRGYKPGFLTEAEFEIGKGINILGGFAKDPYKLVLESGWDRWDALEKYKTYQISSNTAERVYGGLELQPNRGSGNPIGLHLIAGKVTTRSDLKSEAQGMIINYPGNWFVGFGLSVHTVLFKK